MKTLGQGVCVMWSWPEWRAGEPVYSPSLRPGVCSFSRCWLSSSPSSACEMLPGREKGGRRTRKERLI